MKSPAVDDSNKVDHRHRARARFGLQDNRSLSSCNRVSIGPIDGLPLHIRRSPKLRRCYSGQQNATAATRQSFYQLPYILRSSAMMSQDTFRNKFLTSYENLPLGHLEKNIQKRHQNIFAATQQLSTLEQQMRKLELKERQLREAQPIPGSSQCPEIAQRFSSIPRDSMKYTVMKSRSGNSSWYVWRKSSHKNKINRKLVYRAAGGQDPSHEFRVLHKTSKIASPECDARKLLCQKDPHLGDSIPRQLQTSMTTRNALHYLSGPGNIRTQKLVRPSLRDADVTIHEPSVIARKPVIYGPASYAQRSVNLLTLPRESPSQTRLSQTAISTSSAERSLDEIAQNAAIRTPYRYRPALESTTDLDTLARFKLWESEIGSGVRHLKHMKRNPSALHRLARGAFQGSRKRRDVQQDSSVSLGFHMRDSRVFDEVDYKLPNQQVQRRGKSRIRKLLFGI